MASEYLVCPKCGTRLQKPASLQVLQEVTKSGGSFIAMGEADDVPCGVCGFRMAKKDIVEGKFDPPSGGVGSTLSAIFALIALGFLLYWCST